MALAKTGRQVEEVIRHLVAQQCGRDVRARRIEHDFLTRRYRVELDTRSAYGDRPRQFLDISEEDVEMAAMWTNTYNDFTSTSSTTATWVNDSTNYYITSNNGLSSKPRKPKVPKTFVEELRAESDRFIRGWDK